ncbi:MAG: FAD-binding oxidoreductase [Actinomycetota bacterium]
MAKQLETRTESPSTPQEAAEVMRGLGKAGTALRARGGGTKFGWGLPSDPSVIVSTRNLNRVLEHNAADMTAVLGAGTPFEHAQSVFASSGQMVALDPPCGSADKATIGGILAANDSGPLRHRYRGARDLVLGMTVALSDGTLAHSGGKVIKNVAGYDIAKLFTGAFGTLGLIVEVVVRLYPRPARTITVTGATDDPAALQEAALAMSHATLEIEALDVAWRDGSGVLLAQFGGVAPEGQAERARSLMATPGLDISEIEDDAELWARQRSGQRAADGEIALKLSVLSTDLAAAIEIARRHGGSLVGRAGLGLLWMRLPATDDAAEEFAAVRSELPRSSAHCVLLDADSATRAKASVWGDVGAGELELMRSIKSRFDPAGVCSPGIYVADL